MVSDPISFSLNFCSKVPEVVENTEKKLSNKRKLIENFPEQEGIKKLKPFPLNWPHHLDIQTGKLYLSETKTSRDPREGGRTELSSRARPAHMRLDLELNLSPSDSSEPKPNKLHADLNNSYSESSDLLINIGIEKEINEHQTKMSLSSSSISAPSWLAFEDDDKSEMVATVCKRCFMLVMLCKASPACPNCKFMHSPDQSAPYIFKRRPTQLLSSHLAI